MSLRSPTPMVSPPTTHLNSHVRYGPQADIITVVQLTLLPKFLCIFPVLTVKIFRFQGSQINPVNASHIDVDLLRIRPSHTDRTAPAVLAACAPPNARTTPPQRPHPHPPPS